MVTKTAERGESPNPYESPRTVATGHRAPARKQRGPRSRDLKNQTVGFAVLAATGAVGVAVALGATLLAGTLPGAPAWDWLDMGLRVAALTLTGVCLPGVLVCVPWTVWSAVRWAMVARGDHFIEPEDAK